MQRSGLKWMLNWKYILYTSFKLYEPVQAFSVISLFTAELSFSSTTTCSQRPINMPKSYIFIPAGGPCRGVTDIARCQSGHALQQVFTAQALFLQSSCFDLDGAN